jgi:hypothetical protein
LSLLMLEEDRDCDFVFVFRGVPGIDFMG